MDGRILINLIKSTHHQVHMMASLRL